MESILFDSIFTEELFSIDIPTTVIIDRPWNEISAEERNLLSKILPAIKLSVDAVTIKHQPKLDLSHWSAKPTHVISFCETASGLPLYEVVSANGVSIVASENLKSLLQNDEAKKRLWQALKKQFSV